MTDQTLQLSDGRTLGYRCLGADDGKPLFFFHGTPGSRIVLTEIDAITKIDGIRFILPERPGYGLSDAQADRTIVGWAADVEELANSLNYDSFAVSGISGGGPHALACACQLPQRVTKTLLFSSPAPPNFKGSTRGMTLGNKLPFLLTRYFPGAIAFLIRNSAKAFKKDPQRSMLAVAKQFCLPDQEILKSDEFRDAVMNDMLEGYRQDGGGHVADAILISKPDWGFRLQDIDGPVFMWHGEDDTLVSKSMANHLEAQIPNCVAYYLSQAGHLLTEDERVVEQFRQVMS